MYCKFWYFERTKINMLTNFNYFKHVSTEISLLQKMILERNNRPCIYGTTYIKNIDIGDILEINFFRNNTALSFSGICICIRKKKKKLLPDMGIILRNVIMGVGVEVVVSFYENRLFNLKIHDYKRKQSSFRGSRLFYIRYRLNKESKV